MSTQQRPDSTLSTLSPLLFPSRADAAFLVLHGALPTSAQKAAFDREITTHTLVNEQVIQFYRGFRPDAHPMAILAGVTGALSSFYKVCVCMESKRREREREGGGGTPKRTRRAATDSTHLSFFSFSRSARARKTSGTPPNACGPSCA